MAQTAAELHMLKCSAQYQRHRRAISWSRALCSINIPNKPQTSESRHARSPVGRGRWRRPIDDVSSIAVNVPRIRFDCEKKRSEVFFMKDSVSQEPWAKTTICSKPRAAETPSSSRNCSASKRKGADPWPGRFASLTPSPFAYLFLLTASWSAFPFNPSAHFILFFYSSM